MKQPKRETLYISKEWDITIIKVTSIPDASYSIYYKNTCESKWITEENFQLISWVLQNDKNILNYVEDTKTNWNTKSVLEILLDMISEQLKPKVEQVSLWGFDSFFDRSTKELDINNFTQGLKKMEEDMNQNLRKVEFDSSMKISEEYLKTLWDKFSLKNLPPIGSWKFLEDIKIEPELDQIKRDPLESGTKSVPKEAETKDWDRMTLKVEYFENKNPKTFGFNGIAGMKDLKDELTNSFLKPLKFKFTVEGKLSDLKGDKKKEKQYRLIYDQYEKFKISIPTGLLFYGPPGTGKTFITKKLAQELGAGLIVKSLGEFGSSYLHQTTVNIKNFFDDAKKASEKGPIILFLDEIDSLLSKRTNSIDANKAEEV